MSIHRKVPRVAAPPVNYVKTMSKSPIPLPFCRDGAMCPSVPPPRTSCTFPRKFRRRGLSITLCISLSGRRSPSRQARRSDLRRACGRKAVDGGGEICYTIVRHGMLVWLSWQSSSLVMSRSPVRIRPQAPKKQHPRGCCFFVCGTSLVQIRKPLVSKALRDAAGAVGGVGEQGKIGRSGRPEDEKEHHSQVDDHAQHLPGDRVKF